MHIIITKKSHSAVKRNGISQNWFGNIRQIFIKYAYLFYAAVTFKRIRSYLSPSFTSR